MTKKDYGLIAASIKGRLENSNLLDTLGWTDHDREIAKATLEDLAYFLAHDLGKQDKRFKRDKFLADCGVTDGNTN